MFGIEIMDAGLVSAMLVALLGGVLSFLSPCVLPIVPPYLAYMGGISVTEMTGRSARKTRVLVPALFFVFGLSTVFLLLGFVWFFALAAKLRICIEMGVELCK